MTRIRQVEPDDIDAVAAVVAQAFVDDPLMVWLLPEAASRLERTLAWWTPIVASYAIAGRGYVTNDATACLLWRYADEQLAPAPGQPPLGDLIPRLVGADRMDSVRAELGVIGGMRPAGSHVYVHVVASAPESQGRGEGTALVRSLARSPRRVALTALVSTNPRNHPFYERNGFTRVEARTVAASAVTATASQAVLDDDA